MKKYIWANHDYTLLVTINDISSISLIDEPIMRKNIKCEYRISIKGLNSVYISQEELESLYTFMTEYCDDILVGHMDDSNEPEDIHDEHEDIREDVIYTPQLSYDNDENNNVVDSNSIIDISIPGVNETKINW